MKGKGNKNNTEELIKDIDDLLLNSPLSVDETSSEDIYVIDYDSIGNNAKEEAINHIQSLISLYKNNEFIKNHPDFKHRIDSEISSLAQMLKMSKMNNTIHDHLATAISKHPDNASLYMAYTRLQSNMLQIDKQIKESINNFNKIFLSYQLEFNFTNDNDNHESSDGSIMTRGNKEFIKQMINQE